MYTECCWILRQHCLISHCFFLLIVSHCVCDIVYVILKMPKNEKKNPCSPMSSLLIVGFCDLFCQLYPSSSNLHNFLLLHLWNYFCWLTCHFSDLLSFLHLGSKMFRGTVAQRQVCVLTPNILVMLRRVHLNQSS